MGNVNLADVESGKILEDRFLILKDRGIMQVFPTSKLPNKGEGLNITDGKGAYVFSGLAAMNGHLTVAMDGKRPTSGRNSLALPEQWSSSNPKHARLRVAFGTEE